MSISAKIESVKYRTIPSIPQHRANRRAKCSRLSGYTRGRGVQTQQREFCRPGATGKRPFAGVHWSAQDTAARQTEVLEACGLRVVRGETHIDIDELSDLLALKGRLEALSRREREEICPRVAAWLGAQNYGAVNHFVRHASPERAEECGHNAEVTEATVRRGPRCARDSETHLERQQTDDGRGLRAAAR